jgi:hypothetical protein
VIDSMMLSLNSLQPRQFAGPPRLLVKQQRIFDGDRDVAGDGTEQRQVLGRRSAPVGGGPQRDHRDDPK